MSSREPLRLDYHCKSCGVGFYDEESFIRHRKVLGHCYCKHCKLDFISDGAMLNHIDQFHYHAEEYCKDCDTSFPDERTEYNHEHCRTCKQPFVDKAALELRTSREHPIRYSCIPCAKSFSDSQALEQPDLFSDSRGYKRHWCRCSFNGQLALHAHCLKEHPEFYLCSGLCAFCHKFFKDRSILVHHLGDAHPTIPRTSQPAVNQGLVSVSQRPPVWIGWGQLENIRPTFLNPGTFGFGQQSSNQLTGVSQSWTWEASQWLPNFQPTLNLGAPGYGQLSLDQRIAAIQSGAYQGVGQPSNPQAAGLQPFVFNNFQPSSQQPLHRSVAATEPPGSRGNTLKRNTLAPNLTAAEKSQQQGLGPMEGVETESTRSKCSQCQKNFRTPDNLGQHMNAVHSLRFRCEECCQVFKSQRKLNLHERTFGHNSMPLGYDKFFKDRESLRKYKAVLHRQKFPCHQCGDKFESAGAFSEHMDRHKGKPVSAFIVCSPCGTRFTTIDKLQKHLGSDIHREDDPILKCIGGTRCKMECISLSQLVSHYESGQCLKLFNQDQIIQILAEYNMEKKDAIGLPIRKRQRTSET